MLNASVGVQRALDRLRPATSHRSSKAIIVQRHSLAIARALRGLVVRPRLDVRPRRELRAAAETIRIASTSPAPERTQGMGSRHVRLAPRSAYAGGAVVTKARSVERRSLVSRLGADRAVPAVAVGILLVATAISSAPGGATAAGGPVGGPTSDGPAARIAAAAGVTQDGPQGGVDERYPDAQSTIAERDGATGGAETTRRGLTLRRVPR